MSVIVVSSGVTSSGLIEGSGQELEVLSGGVALATTVLSGGIVTVSSGGSLSGANIEAGGKNRLWDGAVEVGVTVSAGADLELNGLVIGSGVTIAAMSAKASGPLSAEVGMQERSDRHKAGTGGETWRRRSP